MATMYLSGDVQLWWRTRYEDVLEGRCEINAWEELNRELTRESLMRTGAVRENQSRPWGTDPSYRQRRTLIDRIRHSDIKKRATSLWTVTYELKLMRRVSITKNDSTTNSVPRDKIVLEGMRRIFETTLEPSHGFRSNCPWYGKNEKERQKKRFYAQTGKLYR